MTAFLNAVGIREVDGVPLLDGTATLLAATEAAVKHPQHHGHLRQPPPALRQGAECGDRCRPVPSTPAGYDLPALHRLAQPTASPSDDGTEER